MVAGSQSAALAMRRPDTLAAPGDGQTFWLYNQSAADATEAAGEMFCVAWTGADAGTAQVFTAVTPATA